MTKANPQERTTDKASSGYSDAQLIAWLDLEIRENILFSDTSRVRMCRAIRARLASLSSIQPPPAKPKGRSKK